MPEQGEGEDMSLSKQQIQELLSRSPFIAFLNMEVIEVDAEKQRIKISTPMWPEMERGAGSGQWNGGPIAGG